MDIDEWGMDPQVRFLRRAFSQMEKTQRDLLERLGISPFDERLRRIRDATLKLFEKVWGIASRWGMPMSEEEITEIYTHCLAYILQRFRIQVPKELLTHNEKIERLVQEATR